MNKKIKWSLLSTLIIGSSLAIVLPIVSCSSNETPVNKETVKVTKGTAEQASEIGTAFAKLVNPGLASNQERIVASQYDTILKTQYSKAKTPEVWEKATNFFSFKKENGELLPFDNAVETIKPTGTYPSADDNDVKLGFSLVLKKEFSATTEELTHEAIKIGEKISILINQRPTGEVLEAIRKLVREVVDPNGTVNDVLTLAQFNQLKQTNLLTNPALLNGLNELYIFNRPGTTGENGRILFSEIVEKIEITNEYNDQGDNSVSAVTLSTLKEGYLYRNTLDELRSTIRSEFIIGRAQGTN
ncbi:MAG: hypothetical protein ACRCVI_01105 [Mycoplasmoidaceae bacterium]